MTEEKKPMKIEFAPGCFDNFDGTQEELDELMKTIQDMFDSGEAQVKAVPLEDMLEEFSDEELEQLAEQLGIDPDEYMIDEDDVEDIQPQVSTKRTLH
jgi:diphthamide synthase (EF-2-diphthine--ammonia ligase)